jgi:hypothetical protein
VVSRTTVGLLCHLAWALGSSVAFAEPLPPNANVVREANGTLAYRALGTGQIRGEERFHISVHPDGSRTVSTISRYGPRDIQRHSLYRVDRALRPIDATVQYWIEGEWRASGLITVDSGGLHASSRSPLGNSAHDLAINQSFAILTHQLSPDAWRALLYDKSAGGVQPLRMYDLSPLAEGPDGILGKLTTQHFDYKGETSITVPAGTFTVDHYSLEDAVDMYVHGPDAILIKWRFEAIDREHVLMTLERTD